MHGVSVTHVITLREHDRAMQELTSGRRPSKYPPHFSIDLLVDDSPGVEIEGARHGFSVIRVDPPDSVWHQRVRVAVERIG